MLDDLKYVHQKDAQDALGVAEKQWQQLQQKYNAAVNYQGIENVVVAGMGGSALGASISKSWLGVKVPYNIVRDYDLPSFVGPKTLFIASSYSGNTEETLAATEVAAKAGAQIAVIASGGKLADKVKEHGHPFLELPTGMQPRMAVFYNLAALVQILESAQLVNSGKSKELAAAGEWLKDQVSSWKPDVPAIDNQAKQIAQEIMGKSAVIYSGPKLYAAAYKWKINFNENAKNVAWCNYYPEFNHNEFLGWTSHPVDKPYAVIELRSNLEHPRVQKRFEVSEKLLSGKRPHPIVVNAQGDTVLKQLLWAVVLGDFVSLYLALLNGLNPSPVDLIEKLKTSLNE